MMITTKLSTQDTIENTPEDIETTMTGKVTDIKTGGDMDILAIITGVITTTHMSNNIADTGSPSTSTDSLMIGGSTGDLDRADTTRNSTDTIQSTVRTDIENKNRWGENNTIPEIIKTIRGMISSTNFKFSVR